jgi:hypothetical protein
MSIVGTDDNDDVVAFEISKTRRTMILCMAMVSNAFDGLAGLARLERLYESALCG